MKMKIADVAERIKESVSMRDIVEFYDIPINSAGFIRCPFHSGDKTPSLKIYDDNKGFYCFGCHAKSSVIDFVMKMEKCSLGDACKKIDRSFNLGLNEEISTFELRKQAAERAQKKRAQNLKKEKLLYLEDEYFRAMAEVERLEGLYTMYQPRNADDFSDKFAGICAELESARNIFEEAENEMREFQWANNL